jgi:hypothetical protein
MSTTTRSRTTAQKHSSVLERDPGLEALGAGIAPAWQALRETEAGIECVLDPSTELRSLLSEFGRSGVQDPCQLH